VQLEIAPDVADGVDGGRAVLAAEEHDLRRPRHTAAGTWPKISCVILCVRFSANEYGGFRLSTGD